jgi:hypothetical protein
VKLVKFAGFFIIITFTLITIGENHASLLGNFALRFHTFEIYTGNADISDITKRISEEAKKLGAEVFMVETASFNDGTITFDIYGTSGAQRYLTSAYIWQGRHTSFFGERRVINYKPLNDLSAEASVLTLRVIGENAPAFEREILSIFPGAHIKTSNTDYFEGLRKNSFTTLALIVCAINLLFSFYDVLLSRRETFVRITLGAGKWRIVALSAAKDALVYILLFAVSAGVLSFVTLIGAYMPFIVLLTGGVILINTAVFLIDSRFNVKRVLSKIEFGDGVLILSYFIKAAVCLAALILSVYAVLRLGIVSDTISEREFAENLKGHYHIEFSLKETDKADLMSVFIRPGIMSDKFYREFYDSFDAVILYNAFQTRNIFFANLHTRDFLTERIPELLDFTSDAEFIIILPKNSPKDIMDSVKYLLKRELNFEEGEYKYETLEYGGKAALPSLGGLKDEFAVARNPVIILINYNPSEYDRPLVNKLGNMGGHQYYAYRADEELFGTFALENRLYYEYFFHTYNVWQKYQDDLQKMRQQMLLAAINAGFLVVISLGVVGLITKIRYRAYGVELAVKKTF